MISEKFFSFQMHFGPTKTAADDDLISEVVRVINACGGFLIEITSEMEGNASFTTIDVHAHDAYSFWDSLKSQITVNDTSKLCRITIAVCEGGDGWNDYLLLHHCDISKKCDNLVRTLESENRLANNSAVVASIADVLWT